MRTILAVRPSRSLTCLFVLAALLLSAVLPARARANPCVGACEQQNALDNIGCHQGYTGQIIAGVDPGLAHVTFTMCIVANWAAMNGCIGDCFGAPVAPDLPTTITTPTTPFNRKCFAMGEPLTLTVNVDSVYADPPVAVRFYFGVDSLTTPVFLGTDDTAADGFTLTYAPSGVPAGIYYITYYVYGSDQEYGIQGTGIFQFKVGGVCTLPGLSGWGAGVAGLLLLTGGGWVLRRKRGWTGIAL